MEETSPFSALREGVSGEGEGGGAHLQGQVEAVAHPLEHRAAGLVPGTELLAEELGAVHGRFDGQIGVEPVGLVLDLELHSRTHNSVRNCEGAGRGDVPARAGPRTALPP